MQKEDMRIVFEADRYYTVKYFVILTFIRSWKIEQICSPYKVDWHCIEIYRACVAVQTRQTCKANITVERRKIFSHLLEPGSSVVHL